MGCTLRRPLPPSLPLFLSEVKDKCGECDKVLAELENIDDEAEELDIDFVKVMDPKIAKSYDIVSFPALVFFKKKFPQFYDGNSHEMFNRNGALRDVIARRSHIPVCLQET